jgi:hypothetical protein
VAAATPDQGEQDFAEIGETVLQLSQGKLTLTEPAYKQLRDCRIMAARWAADNKDIAEMDGGIAELEYICYLALTCAVSWEEKGRAVQHDLNKTQFEAFSSTDFRKITKLMLSYAGNESQATG